MAERNSGVFSRGGWFAVLVGVLMASGLAACAPAPTPPMPGTFVGFADPESLEAHLLEEGMQLSLLGESKYAWFDVPGTTYEVGEAGRNALFVHAYRDAAAARAAARRVSPDGRRVIDPEGTEILIEWLGQPQLYLSGPLLVVYVGSDAGELRQLEEALGAPFAGGSALGGT